MQAYTKLAALLKLNVASHSIPDWLQNINFYPCKSRNSPKEHGQILSGRNLSSVRIISCMLFK